MKRNFHDALFMPIGLMNVVKKPAPRTKNLRLLIHCLVHNRFREVGLLLLELRRGWGHLLLDRDTS